MSSGTSLTLGINLIANNDSEWDLIYYERATVPDGILLDWVVVQISDGTTWYTIFNWGDELPDANTNVDYRILPDSPQSPEEPDQRYIAPGNLYSSSGLTTGIAIDIDSIVPPGTYSYIRFYAPPADFDGHAEIDAIEVLPP